MAKRGSNKPTAKKGASKRGAATRRKAAGPRKSATRAPKRAPRRPARQSAGAAKVRRVARKGAGKAARPAAAPSSAPARPARKPASGLTRKDIERFRELLLAKRSELLGDMTTMQTEALNRNRQEATGDLSSMPIHMADLGTDNYEQEFTLGLIEGERALLREIDEALERIENGTYGICQATGQPIGKARLKARPWAKYCYEYMLAQERQQGSRF